LRKYSFTALLLFLFLQPFMIQRAHAFNYCPQLYRSEVNLCRGDFATDTQDYADCMDQAADDYQYCLGAAIPANCYTEYPPNNPNGFTYCNVAQIVRPDKRYILHLVAISDKFSAFDLYRINRIRLAQLRTPSIRRTPIIT